MASQDWDAVLLPPPPPSTEAILSLFHLPLLTSTSVIPCSWDRAVDLWHMRAPSSSAGTAPLSSLGLSSVPWQWLYFQQDKRVSAERMRITMPQRQTPAIESQESVDKWHPHISLSWFLWSSPVWAPWPRASLPLTLHLALAFLPLLSQHSPPTSPCSYINQLHPSPCLRPCFGETQLRCHPISLS